MSSGQRHEESYLSVCLQGFRVSRIQTRWSDWTLGLWISSCARLWPCQQKPAHMWVCLSTQAHTEQIKALAINNGNYFTKNNVLIYLYKLLFFFVCCFFSCLQCWRKVRWSPASTDSWPTMVVSSGLKRRPPSSTATRRRSQRPSSASTSYSGNFIVNPNNRNDLENLESFRLILWIEYLSFCKLSVWLRIWKLFKIEIWDWKLHVWTFTWWVT